MEHIRVLSGRLIAAPLFCEYMNHNRSLHTLGLVKKPHHLAHIMAIYRAKVSQSHIFKEHSRDKKLFNAAFCPSHGIYHGSSYTGDLLHCLIQAHLHSCVCFRGTNNAEVI